MKQIALVPFAFAVALLALPATFQATAHAQSADLVLCDRLAADPADPDKPADVPGVTTIPKADVATERAAAGGNPRGVSNMAAVSGGTSANPAQARAQLTKAAEANVAEAQFQLGMMLADGEGGAKDEAGARALFEKAAAQNHSQGLLWAGSFAQRGVGGPEDTTRAKDYFTRAAALGNEEAKDALKRIECPYVLKDKRGQVMTNLCF